MGTVGFLITKNVAHHVFSKDTFKYMYMSYTSGITGSIYLYFSAEGNIVDPDLITLTVKKDKMTQTAQRIPGQMCQPIFHEYTTDSLSTQGVNQHITAITYTAG